MTIEVTRDELLLIIKALTTGQFHLAEHNAVYDLAVKLRALISS